MPIFSYYQKIEQMYMPVVHANSLLTMNDLVYIHSLDFLLIPSASGDITRQGFRVTSGLIFWYVTLEAMWYMYNIVWYINMRINVENYDHNQN